MSPIYQPQTQMSSGMMKLCMLNSPPRTQVNSDASQFSHQTGNSTAAAAAHGRQTHLIPPLPKSLPPHANTPSHLLFSPTLPLQPLNNRNHDTIPLKRKKKNVHPKTTIALLHGKPPKRHPTAHHAPAGHLRPRNRRLLHPHTDAGHARRPDPRVHGRAGRALGPRARQHPRADGAGVPPGVARRRDPGGGAGGRAAPAQEQGRQRRGQGRHGRQHAGAVGARRGQGAAADARLFGLARLGTPRVGGEGGAEDGGQDHGRLEGVWGARREGEGSV